MTQALVATPGTGGVEAINPNFEKSQPHQHVVPTEQIPPICCGFEPRRTAAQARIMKGAPSSVPGVLSVHSQLLPKAVGSLRVILAQLVLHSREIWLF